MRPVAALAILRRASWRRCGAALAVLALLLQGIGGALLMRAEAASWDEAAAICHGTGDDSGGAAGTGDGNSVPHHGPACPLCLALQHCGTVLPPAAAAILPPPASTPVALATPQAAPGGGRVDRPNLPRGPPLSG
jgi:hypothetical protein